jgi:hypothetical protein
MSSDARFHARLFWLQSAAREIMIGKRVGVCCRLVVPGKSVQIWGNTEKARAKYRNVVRCANVWMCPVCANNISANRRDDLQFVIDKMSKHHIAVMLTFTVRHTRSDELSDTLRTVTEAWRRMISCRSWSSLKKKGYLAGYVRALETTWGSGAGWHPHIHALFFVSPEACIASFYKNTRLAWERAVHTVGGDSEWDYACSMTICDGSVAEYITKWGHEPSTETRQTLNNWGKAKELTRSALKQGKVGHLTPFQILEQYQLNGEIGPAFWGKLYREYCDAFRGQRQLVWSRKPDLRKLVGLSEEKSEAEIVEGEEAGYYLLATLSSNDWDAILREGMRGVILDCAARGDLDMMRAIVTDCRKEQERKALLVKGWPKT